MTVKELIAELTNYPDNAEVTVLNIVGNDVPPIIAYNDETNIINIF